MIDLIWLVGVVTFKFLIPFVVLASVYTLEFAEKPLT